MYRVMLVDDNEALRMAIRRFKIWGEQDDFDLCFEAINGINALNILEKEKVDLLITDIRMPKIDGIELLQKIVEENIDTCVVFISEYSEFEYARKGLKLGAFDYLVKPVKEPDLKDLFIRVKEYLESKASEHFTLPENEVESIISKILKSDNTYITDVDALFSAIADFTKENVREEAYVIKDLIDKLIKAAQNKYPWSRQFEFFESLNSTDLLNIDSSKSLYEAAKNIIVSIINFLNTFIFLNIDNKIVKNVCECVLSDKDTDLSLSSLSQKLFLNSSHISSTFKNKTGITLSDYLLMVKMEKAKKLLCESSLKSYEIASKLGYKDNEYFSKLFKKYTGISPSQYKIGK